MYVMTPFTSLLVLENEAMYAQLQGGSRPQGPLGHVPLPGKIPVVYEPDPFLAVDVRNAPRGDRPERNEVMNSIMVNVPARVLTWPGQPQPFQGRRVVTALHLLSNNYAYAESEKLGEGITFFEKRNGVLLPSAAPRRRESIPRSAASGALHSISLRSRNNRS